MKNIKYRQPLYYKGKFNMWHYWSFVNGKEHGFTSPQNHHTESYPIIDNLLTRDNQELYEGDIVDLYDWGIHSSNNIIGRAIIEWDDDYKQWDYRMIDGETIDDRYDIWRAGRVLVGNIIENPELVLQQ